MRFVVTDGPTPISDINVIFRSGSSQVIFHILCVNTARTIGGLHRGLAAYGLAMKEAEYELLLTQRLILQPRAELTAYGKDDAVNGLGSGLSDVALGLRLRYEFSRQFAPYVGVEWNGTFGATADQARANGDATKDTRYVAGIRFWF